jgi:hypothetical protein
MSVGWGSIAFLSHAKLGFRARSRGSTLGGHSERARAAQTKHYCLRTGAASLMASS